jgi:hypothetical protein
MKYFQANKDNSDRLSYQSSLPYRDMKYFQANKYIPGEDNLIRHVYEPSNDSPKFFYWLIDKQIKSKIYWKLSFLDNLIKRY